MRALAAAVLLLLCSCTYYKEHRLGNFSLAMQRPSKVESPPVLRVGALPSDLPGATAYAGISGDFDGGSEVRHAHLLKKRALEAGFAPDFLVFEPRGAAFAGVTSTYLGFGVTTSSANYRPQGFAYCMRLAPTSTGMQWDDNQMVTGLSDAARAPGIQEGDTLISIDGAAVKPSGGEQAAWATTALRKQPGEKVRIVWIRPGTGRMDGELTLAEPRPWPAGLTSFTEAYEKSIQQVERSRDNVWKGGGP